MVNPTARVFPFAMVLGSVFAQGGPAEPAPPLDDTTFASLWQHVVPTADELAWRRIPWLGTLAEAVVAAQAADRPILLWAMNGHPLACT
jgi:hypothetical protein